MHILEEHIDDFEVWERISFKEFRCGFVPLDSDVISLDMDYVFKQVGCKIDFSRIISLMPSNSAM
jgi:hypothetical protein